MRIRTANKTNLDFVSIQICYTYMYAHCGLLCISLLFGFDPIADGGECYYFIYYHYLRFVVCISVTQTNR